MRKFYRTLTKQLEEQLHPFDGITLLGKLAVKSKFDVLSSIHQIPETQIMAIQIEPVSFEPLHLRRVRETMFPQNTYTALDKDQLALVIGDLSYHNQKSVEKVRHWNKMLKNKLIVFKVIVKKKGHQTRLVIQIQNVETSDDIALMKTYEPIINLNYSPSVMSYKLHEEKKLTLLNLAKPPVYLINDDHLYYDIGEWRNNNEFPAKWFNDESFKTFYNVPLKSVVNAVGGDWIETINDLTFVDEFAFRKLENLLPTIGSPVEKVLEKPAELMKNTIFYQEETTQKPEIDGINIKSEAVFMDEFQGLTISEHLLYDRFDLINFHISLKINPLTVVAGMSGTGKTRLAKSYANILGLTEENGDLLFLPISPSYLEPSDVLGFLNPSTGYYMPSVTGLVDILVKAQRNPQQMYMVIFDEMNLSQIEHWFAPFLSILEKPENDRLLYLYSENNPCHNAEFYPYVVNIGSNIRFVGTINLDETTKELSDRVLDRINLVTLEKASFRNYSELVLNQNEYRGITFDFNNYNIWCQDFSPMSVFTNSELKMFDALHELIFKYDNGKGVSFRFLNRLGKYLQNIPLNISGSAEISRLRAIDISIKQGLLTKIKGSSQQIGPLVGTLTNVNDPITNSELYKFFTNSEYARMGQFKHTTAEIKRKALELGIYGYTN